MKTCKHPTCKDECRKPPKGLKRVPIKRTVKKKEPISSLMGKAQKVFNNYIRERDSAGGYFTCISCSKTLPIDKMNAGHYVPVSRCSFLRLNEWNVNGECQGCNCFDEGHLIGYRRNLINKIGADTVNWLEDNRHVTKRWTRQELIDIILKYSKQIKVA